MREPVDRGLPESQLELHYQPVVRLDGSGVYGAETFLRWRHPERGVLRAGQWLPYAIRSGAAVALSAAVLPAWAACARRLPGLVLSFNVTGWDLIDDRYVASIRAVAAEGAAGLAVEVPYLQFHPKVAAGRSRPSGAGSSSPISTQAWRRSRRSASACGSTTSAATAPTTRPRRWGRASMW